MPGLATLALLLPLRLCATTPDLTVTGKIQGLLAQSSTERSVTTVDTPAIGDLHKRLTGLPDSCEVLVAVNSSSVNPSDRSTPGPFPQVMGSDVAGTVLEVEASCKRLKPGDHVWADIGANVHAGAAKGKENGAYGQIAVALETQLGPMPSNLGFAEASALPKVALTSYKALVWYGGAPYSVGKSVLVLGGSGGCGIAGIQLARAMGADSVITTTSAANAEFVRQLGASQVIDYHTQNWWDVIADGSVDAIYDTVGQVGTGDRAMRKLKSGGYYVTIVGALPSSPRNDTHSNMFINSDTNLANLELLEALRGFAESGKLRMPRLKAYPLHDVLLAFNESAGGHVVGKLVVAMPPVAAPRGPAPKGTVIDL